MSDNRVQQLRKVVLAKTEKLGEQPKAVYKTNLKFENQNILTMTLDKVVETLAHVLVRREKFDLATQMIDVDLVNPYEDLVDDLTLRGKILAYNVKKSELDALVKKLDDLRSEDLKKSDELDSIEELLK